jgi:hypothetical protein
LLKRARARDAIIALAQSQRSDAIIALARRRQALAPIRRSQRQALAPMNVVQLCCFYTLRGNRGGKRMAGII